ncbi:MAG: NAD-dependent epimerase/dehydratase family protein [Kofleriaceae bacterium]|nr:NAD-dependent epimerase/dehydratase family protein [Myxococcales bacterium]MCB9561564.1 NAD-dependent epimerase/dehydratase family protein [Kofleriaceae bacterium]MCB9572282.1 NAD-dependent epimerase/dehydratase family protein [Kofleriaceae bacterium]
MSLAVITGASGLLGGNLAEALLGAGHRVRATRRASTRVAHLDDLAIEWVDADLADPGALTAAFDGADVVFHCAAAVGVRKGVSAAMRAANVDGTAHVLEAVRAARVPRLVHTSSVVAVGLSTDGRPCDEQARWNFDEAGLLDGYAITKHEAEERVRAAAGAGVDAVIVNPTYMFGARDARPSSGSLIVDIVRGKVPGWTSGYNNFVDVRDVARGMIAAWQRGQRGERYILGGHDQTYRDIMRTIARLAGVRPPRWQVPQAIARVAGRVGDLAERLLDRDPLINSITVRYAYTDRFRFRCDRARRELDYTISPIEPAIVEALAWFRSHGLLPPRL